MDLQDIEIELSMPPKQKVKMSQVKCATKLVTVIVLLNSCCLLLSNANGQLLSLQPRMIQKRSDRTTPALRGLLDTLLQPTRTASSSNGWKGFVFMDPLFKVSRSPPSRDSLIEPQQSQLPRQALARSPPPGSQNDPSAPSFPMDNPQYETESAPIPYIIEPPMDMYQPMASNTRYSTAKHPYNDYYDDEVNADPPIPRLRIRTTKSKSTTTTTKKPNQTPAISIGPASGGGTAIRLGKAKITFKKGSISLGPVEDSEIESKRSNNDDKSSEKHVINKGPHRNYPDESDSNDYLGPSSSSSSSRHQSLPSDNRDNRNHPNNKANGESRPVYIDDDYGPKYATNYKTSASGYYQSYKPYHNLDTLIDKQVNLNQDTGSSNFSPQPVYQGNTRNTNNNILTSSVTESYNTKNDYDYEDSVITERPSNRNKKARDKRRDETISEDDDEVSPSRSLVTEKRRKGGKKNDQSNKRGMSENDEDNDSKTITETIDDSDEDTSETSTEKVSSSSTTAPGKATRKKLPKSKNQQSGTTATTKSISRSSNRAKTKSTAKQTTATSREDIISLEDKKLVKEHRNENSDKDDDEDDGDHHDEEKEKVKTNEDNEDEEDEEEIKSISKTTSSTQPTISSNESKKRKTNSRQNTSRRKSNHQNSKQILSSTVVIGGDSESHQQSIKSSTDGTVYIGNQGQSSKIRKGSIESVSILPGTSSSSSSERGGTIVTLKMSDDPSLGVIAGSTNSKKPGAIYQIRLTSKIPTESASAVATVPVITKVPEEGPIEVTKDEISINRLIKMMQETLEDIRKTSASSSLPPSPSPSSSPCPPQSVIIEPIPPSTITTTTITTTPTPKPSLIISNLIPTTNKPVDPFLNLHHGNITIVPASMGNVSDIVEMLVKTSKFNPPSSSSSLPERQKQSTRVPTEIIITTDDPSNKRNEDNDYSIDLDNSSINTNNSDRPQAEESRSKGLRQNFNQQQSNVKPETTNDQISVNKQSTNDNTENGDDVPIIVVLLPPEDELSRDTIN